MGGQAAARLFKSGAGTTCSSPPRAHARDRGVVGSHGAVDGPRGEDEPAEEASELQHVRSVPGARMPHVAAPNINARAICKNQAGLVPA